MTPQDLNALAPMISKRWKGVNLDCSFWPSKINLRLLYHLISQVCRNFIQKSVNGIFSHIKLNHIILFISVVIELSYIFTYILGQSHSLAGGWLQAADFYERAIVDSIDG